MTKSKILAAIVEDIVIVKIEGKGSFQNSKTLKEFLDKMLERGYKKFIFDFNDCITMDSTFMGTLAGLSIKLKKSGEEGKIVIVSPNKQCYRLLTTLGLDRIIEIRSKLNNIGDVTFEKVEEKKSMSKEEQVIMAIEAHENLIKISPENEVKFKNVLSLLREYLDKGEE